MRLRGSVILVLLKAAHSHQAVVQQTVHTPLKYEGLNVCLYFLGLNVMRTETEMCVLSLLNFCKITELQVISKETAPQQVHPAVAISITSLHL